MNGLETVEGSLTLYKRVSKDLMTQENTENETRWTPDTTVTHKNWHPTDSECGAGKFHACAAPYLADEFRDVEGDRYVALSIKVADLYAWRGFPQYPNKVAFREGKVLHECDRYGEKM